MTQLPYATNEPLPAKVTNELRYILEGARSGRLNHDQQLFHSGCGTAHCVAGWKIVMDEAANTGKTGLKDSIQGKLERDNPTGFYPDWWYAMKEWTLSKFESYILFNQDSKFYHQFPMLEMLEAGYRFDCEYGAYEVNRLTCSDQDELQSGFDEGLFEDDEQLKMLAEKMIAYEYPKQENVEIVESILRGDFWEKETETQTELITETVDAAR